MITHKDLKMKVQLQSTKIFFLECILKKLKKIIYCTTKMYITGSKIKILSLILFL